MYASIRHVFAAFCSHQVADLTTEIGSLRNQLCSLRKSRDEWRRECQHASAHLALAERAQQAAAANVAAREEELSRSQSAEHSATEQLRAAQGRQASLEADLERLRGEVRQAQHELDMSNRQLELACKENELLAKIHQGDLARRERELAIEKRGKTDAELASQTTMFDAGETVANA